MLHKWLRSSSPSWSHRLAHAVMPSSLSETLAKLIGQANYLCTVGSYVDLKPRSCDLTNIAWLQPIRLRCAYMISVVLYTTLCIYYKSVLYIVSYRILILINTFLYIAAWAQICNNNFPTATWKIFNRNSRCHCHLFCSCKFHILSV